MCITGYVAYKNTISITTMMRLQVECEKGPYSDKQGFASLVKELRSAFDTRGLLLSAAVSGSKRVIDYGKHCEYKKWKKKLISKLPVRN